MQTLEVKVPVQIPEKYRLVETDEYNQLQNESLTGRMWTMTDLRNWIGNKSADWIKDNVLFNPSYKSEIDEMRANKEIAGGGKGSPYHFKAARMAEFIEKHFKEMEW